MGRVVYDFSGQVALVTGAASGLGLAAAVAFAESGAKVALSDVNEAALTSAVEGLRNKGHDVLGIRCDVRDDAQVKATVDKTVATFGRLDAAFNNAGIVTRMVNLDDMSEEEYDRVLGINLRGVWSSMKYELKQMRKQGSGAIVNCSSLAGLVGGAGRSQYHAAKHGMLGMTKSVAIEVAPLGIRVNAICPGTIHTPLVDRMAADKDLEIRAVEAGVPIKRMGRPKEIADAVLWLCSEGSTYVIGQPIAVDGGHTIQ